MLGEGEIESVYIGSRRLIVVDTLSATGRAEAGAAAQRRGACRARHRAPQSSAAGTSQRAREGGVMIAGHRPC
jgi:hypothetical protein